MTTSIADAALVAFELQQLIVDYCSELDRGGGDAPSFFTEDGSVEVGRMSISGRMAMQKFYDDHAEHVRTGTPGGVRTARHVFSNPKLAFADPTRATVTGIMTNYSAAGMPPLLNATSPTVVSDVRFEFRREPGARWLIERLGGAPIFVGNDPMQTKTLVGEK